MDKSSSSGASYSKDNTQPPQRPQNSSRNFRSRQQGERDLPYTDLRELLNHKRQNPDSKNGGPPSDPKYNYLSDPMRDGESSNGTISSGTNSNNYNNNNFGFGRSSNRSNFRSPRGRGRSSFNNFPQEVSYQHHPKPGPSNEAGRFPREWDQGKEDPRNRRYNTFKNPQYPGPSSDTSNFQYQDARPINPNYKGPPHKYNPNYRGGSQKFFPRRYPHPDPVNISVEYNVEDGFRKCTALDVKLDKVWKKGQNKKNIQQQKHPEDEENWDDVTSNPTKVGYSKTEFPNTKEGINPDVTPEVRRPRKNYNTSRNKYIKPEYTKKQNKKIVEEQQPLEVEENWDEDVTPHETVKKDNPETKTQNINENKPEKTTPEVERPRKISTGTKTDEEIEATPKNEQTKSEENIPEVETGPETSKTKIQSNDGDKTTSEVHKRPNEEIPEGTKLENAEKNIPEIETGPEISKTEIQSNDEDKNTFEVSEGTTEEIPKGTKSENAEKNIPEVETGPEISKTEVQSNNGDKNTSEVHEGPIKDISAGTSEIPKGTSEIPEGTSKIPKGTSKVHEGPSEITEESAKVDETPKDEKNTPNVEESPTTTEKEAK